MFRVTIIWPPLRSSARIKGNTLPILEPYFLLEPATQRYNEWLLQPYSKICHAWIYKGPLNPTVDRRQVANMAQRLVGRDLDGNRFYELPAANGQL